MTIKLALSKQDEMLIEEQLLTGHYSNAVEVVSAGLQILTDIQNERDSWIEADIARRLEEAENNPGKLKTLESVFTAIEQRHAKRMTSTGGR